MKRAAAWEEHERLQRQAWLRLAPAQHLQWLWEAKPFAQEALPAWWGGGRVFLGLVDRSSGR